MGSGLEFMFMGSGGCFPICGHFGAINEIFEGILFTRLLQELWVLVSLVFYVCVYGI